MLMIAPLTPPLAWLHDRVSLSKGRSSYLHYPVASELEISSKFFVTLSETRSQRRRVRVYDWPLPQELPPCFEILVHAGPVTALMVAPDDNFVLTCGEDGCVFVLGIKVWYCHCYG